LSHARRVGLRAHPSEIRIGDIGLDASEDDVVEQIEHVDAESELQPRHAEVAPDAEILIERARVPQIERERPGGVPEGERGGRLERVAVDVSGRRGTQHVTVPEVAVDPDIARETGSEIGVAGPGIRQIAGGENGAKRPARSELRDARYL